MILAIDPGKNGGIVRADEKGNILQLHKMPKEEKGIDDQIFYPFSGEICDLFIERVPVFTARQTTEGVTGFSAAKVYGNYMYCKGLARGYDIQITELSPIKWQNAVRCRNFTNLDYNKWKNKLKQHALKHFPKEKVTLWNCDALLILMAGLQFLNKK